MRKQFGHYDDHQAATPQPSAAVRDAWVLIGTCTRAVLDRRNAEKMAALLPDVCVVQRRLVLIERPTQFMLRKHAFVGVEARIY
eukprot:CAMPEP_0184390026 /NCGR_PEP_ID=MMETSP0007-20130409/12990_1 /TAXON_ID=97485 /ORGANISM="Prymnesium parvum, Strain Texoma1" /LENGTH=83 /DNA_ID=CAMNT_0026739605 /DNA_START=454 /DNA_END=705 /DNA_ORIENTATION=-